MYRHGAQLRPHSRIRSPPRAHAGGLRPVAGVAVVNLTPPDSQSGTIQLAGSVTDAAWRPLAGARVEVVEGPQAGLSTTTDANGDYFLRGSFDDATRFRATKDGHAPSTFSLPPACDPCNPHWWIHFALEALAPKPNLAGDYSLTVIANSACAALPDAVRSRTYEATVTLQSGPDFAPNSQFEVSVSTPPFLEQHRSFPAWRRWRLRRRLRR